MWTYPVYEYLLFDLLYESLTTGCWEKENQVCVSILCSNVYSVEKGSWLLGKNTIYMYIMIMTGKSSIQEYLFGIMAKKGFVQSHKLVFVLNCFSDLKVTSSHLAW